MNNLQIRNQVQSYFQEVKAINYPDYYTPNEIRLIAENALSLIKNVNKQGKKNEEHKKKIITAFEAILIEISNFYEKNKIPKAGESLDSSIIGEMYRYIINPCYGHLEYFLVWLDGKID